MNIWTPEDPGYESYSAEELRRLNCKPVKEGAYYIVHFPTTNREIIQVLELRERYFSAKYIVGGEEYRDCNYNLARISITSPIHQHMEEIAEEDVPFVVLEIV